MPFLTLEQVILKMTKIIFTFLQNHWILKTTLLGHLQGTEEWWANELCLPKNALLLFVIVCYALLAWLGSSLCETLQSTSSGLQMFTPGECLRCGGSLRPHPSTIKSHSEGELTLSSCQLCSAPELSVHWCYPANTGCALPKICLLSWLEKIRADLKLQTRPWFQT